MVLINVYIIILFGRIIFSFIRAGLGQTRNQVMDNIYLFLWTMTEPLLKPVRELIPALRMGGGGIDFSPIVVLIILRLLQRIIISFVYF